MFKLLASVAALLIVGQQVAAHPEMLTQDLPPLTALQLSTQAAAFECQSKRLAAQGSPFSALSIDNMKSTGACTADPETTQGPYFVTHEMMRQNITDGHRGIPLQLQIEVVDTNTCEGLPMAGVEIWSTDAKGYYAGFTGINPDTMKREGECLEPEKAKMVALQEPVPPGPGPGPRPSDMCMTDLHTFMRGVQFTSASGVATFDTIIPGYYISRTCHFHVVIWTGGEVKRVIGKDIAPEGSAARMNGTVLFNATSRHIGQFFFNDDEIQSLWKMANDIYPTQVAGNRTANYTLLDNDMVWKQAGGVGLLTLAPKTTADNVLTDGLIGKVTVYVDSQFDAKIQNMNYLFTDKEVTGAASGVFGISAIVVVGIVLLVAVFF